MSRKKIMIANIMNAINACTEMNFQKRVVILLDVLCSENGYNFEKVQPSNGDAKNDGWIVDKNIYFACYSPNDATVSQNKQIVSKLEGDLDGLCTEVYKKNKWGKKIEEFYLIVNTHDKDLPADPDRLRDNKINEIKKKYNVDFKAKVITTQEIKKYLLTVDEKIIEKISDNMEIETLNSDFSVSDIYEFVDGYFIYLASQEINVFQNNNLARIKIENKIEINSLKNLKDHILSLIPKADKIEQYISFVIGIGESTEKYEKLKDYIINKYNELEKDYNGEDLYNKLIDTLIYDTMKDSYASILETFVVYIFIRCDIFKKE